MTRAGRVVAAGPRCSGRWRRTCHADRVPTPPDPTTADARLRELCRQLAAMVSWDRSVGDDAPRFGLMFRERADGLLVAARALAAHPSLVEDDDLRRRVDELDRAVARHVEDPWFNREVVAATHEVAERAEDLLGAGRGGPLVVEVPPTA